MAVDEAVLRDGYGRVINYVRVSLTEACNYRCRYCMPEGDGSCSAAAGNLTREETLRLCGVLAKLGVASFKITGGEPFMAPDAMAVLAGLKAGAGVRSVTVTTNGFLLDRHVRELAAVGIDGVNVSLNAMTREKYDAIVGAHVDVDRIVENILLAKSAGLLVKLNMVPLRGVNETEIAPLLEFALEHDIPVRFIELMPLGQGRRYAGLSRDEVRAIIEKRFGPTTITGERFGNGPAVYMSVGGFSTRIGYIAAVSRRFCATCNRLRLSSSGYLRTCLHHEDRGVDLAEPLRQGESDGQIAARIRRAVAAKPEGHLFAEGAVEEMGLRPMYRIGG